MPPMNPVRLISNLFARPVRKPKGRPCYSTFANSARSESDRDFTAFVANITAHKHGEGGWVLLAPYGKWPNADGLQIFDRASASEIVANYHSTANAIRRTMGIPFYVGHPDHPTFSDRFLDTSAKGRIKELEARDDGLHARVAWNSQGKRIIEEEEFDGHSVNWRMRRDPGGGGWRPFQLKSVGFTNEPNIPVPAIETANTKPNTNIMKDWLIKLLGLKAEDTDETVQNAANAILADATKYRDIVNATKLESAEARQKFADEHKEDPIIAQVVKVEAANIELAKKLETFEATVANERKEKTEQAEKLATAEKDLVNSREAAKTSADALVESQKQFANERTAHIATLVEWGFKDSRIPAANKKQWEQDFANDFTGTAKKLGDTKPTLNTRSVVNTREGRSKAILQSHQRAEKIAVMVNQMRVERSMDYDQAFNALRIEHPELWTQ